MGAGAERAPLPADPPPRPRGFLTARSRRDLYRDEWVCVVAADNPVADVGLTVEDLQTMPWVATYHGPTASTPAARQLRSLGIEPHVQVVTESFRSIPDLIAGSDRIALVQERLAVTIPPSAGVRAVPCGVDLDPLVAAID